MVVFLSMMLNNMKAAPGAACAISLILASFVPCDEAFIAATGGGRLSLSHRTRYSVRNTPAADWRKEGIINGNLNGNLNGSPFRHAAGFVRPRSTARGASDGDLDSLFGDSVGDSQEGSSDAAAGGSGWEEDMEEVEDAPEMTKEFYSQVAARWNTTVEGAMEVEKDFQFDKALYDELRTRRDFGFEQDLGLELEKRNISKEAEVTKIVDEGLEAMPGVTSTATFMPSAELTPREVVTSVLEALKNNDHPYHNHGIEVFMRFLSPSSAMYGVELEGVARFMAENRNRAFMHWDAISYPRPLTLSGGKKKNKAFQPLKLKDTMTGSWHPVSVYLTLDAKTNYWRIESFIMKGDL